MNKKNGMKLVVTFALVIALVLGTVANSAYAAGWKKEDNRWYYEKSAGVNETGWKKIDGKWYFFDEFGVMASNEYRRGYWLTKSGAMSGKYTHGKWRRNKTGWWYQDGRWYPKSQWLWIDGYSYHFNAEGYLDVSKTVGKYRVNADGRWIVDGQPVIKNAECADLPSKKEAGAEGKAEKAPEKKTDTVVESTVIEDSVTSVDAETKDAEPKAEEPKAEESKSAEPEAEEPKAEEPKAEEPKAEEPKAEEPKAEEPKAEEPKAEEPKAEEPQNVGPETDDLVDENPENEDFDFEDPWANYTILDDIDDDESEDEESEVEELVEDDPTSHCTVHSWSWNRTITKPTCTEPGVYEYKCAFCEAKKDVEAPATGHAFYTSQEVLPTPTTAGHTSKTVCLNCGLVTEEEQTVYWDIEQYSYEIIPLLKPMNDYFYIKTDNPEPDSFVFVDKSTKYVGADSDTTATIKVDRQIYADVKYEDADLRRVNGGYIARGICVDGGELVLCHRVCPKWWDEHLIETDTVVTIHRVMDEYDYMIENYATESADFFDNMDAVTSELFNISVYSGAGVRGPLQTSDTKPYYGVMPYYYKDQLPGIWSPYSFYTTGVMLSSWLFPFNLESISFPDFQRRVALRLDEDVQVKWSDDYHYIIEVTHDGVTEEYGGQGRNIGAHQIDQSQVTYWFAFDGSESDASQNCTLEALYDMQIAYAKMETGDDPGMTEPELKWSEIIEKVGSRGRYVKMAATYIDEDRVERPVYSFIWNDKNNRWTSLGDRPASVKFLTNTWYEGRYYDFYECFLYGKTFADSLADKPSVVIKGFTANLPEPDEGIVYTYLDKFGDKYTVSSDGTCEGYFTFTYDEELGKWVAKELRDNLMKEYDTGYGYKADTSSFLDGISLSENDLLAMDLDYNCTAYPTEYVNYDGTVKPGTEVMEAK